MNFIDLAQRLNAQEKVDVSDFQRRARVLQSMWREQMGHPLGEHVTKSGSRPLGSRLLMPWAEETLSNFISEPTREVVLSKVCDPEVSTGRLFSKPRIFNDLLSSQPLCFNLFAELSFDLELISSVIRGLTSDRFMSVESIDFEYSPGRSDDRYLADRSAFDVFLTCKTLAGKPGFIGIEVKYHENLLGKAGKHRNRYDEVAKFMACFTPDAREVLMNAPLQQIWRDHLLTGATRDVDGYNDALFVILYPQDNLHVTNAVAKYKTYLTNSDSFADWTMEAFTNQLRQRTDSDWINLFIDRYLAFEKIDSILVEGITYDSPLIFAR